jgi:transcriptional regulator with XRE-family HTH domain
MHSLGEQMKIDTARVAALMKSQGHTYRSLEKEAATLRPGISYSTIWQVINNRREPTFDVVQAIAAALNTTVGYIIGESENPSADGAEPAVVVPAVEFVPLVRRLNDVPQMHREYYISLIEAALEFEKLAETIQSVGELPDAKLAALETDVERRERRLARRGGLLAPRLRLLNGQVRVMRGLRGTGEGHGET